jgi:hypothetical protein
MELIKEDNFFTDKTDLIEFVLGNCMPWYFHQCSTSNNFPFFSHTVMARTENEKVGRINSDLYDVMHEILIKFCRDHNLEVNNIFRMSFNAMWNYGELSHTDPHVDFKFDHKVLIMYFTDNNGDTLIYNKKYDGTGQTSLYGNKSLEVQERVTPKLGKAVCFDGNKFHANEFCKPSDRRVVFVTCFN